MIFRTFNRGAAVALLAVMCAGAAHAVTQPPKGNDWARDAVRPHADIPAPSRHALFIARSLDGPARDDRARAPLPGINRIDRDRADGRREYGDRRDARADRRPGDHHALPHARGDIVLPGPAAAVAAPVPIPAAAPLLFAALGGLALLGRRAHGKDRDRGASEA